MTKSSVACELCIEALVKTGKATFWTFTFDTGFALGDMGSDHEEAAEQWDKCLRAFRKARPDLAGVRVFEPHKNGRLHIHAVLNGYLPIGWVKAFASQFGFGRINCKKAEKGLDGYLSKYLRKGLKVRHRHFRKGRRLWASFGKFGGKSLVKNIEVESNYGTFFRWWSELPAKRAEIFFISVERSLQGKFGTPMLPSFPPQLGTRGQRWHWGKRIYNAAQFWKLNASEAVLSRFSDAMAVVP